MNGSRAIGWTTRKVCSPVQAVLFIAVLTMASCTSELPVPSAYPATLPVYSTPAVTITFACPDDLCSAYEPLIEAFCSFHSDIDVHLISWEESVGDELFWGVGATTRLALAADVAVAPARLGPSVTRQGLLHDLTPFIEADHAFEAEDFWAGVLDAYRWDGGTWAVPFEMRLHLLLYDQDVFAAAGVLTPQSDWNHDDFLAVAQALTLQRGDVVQRYGFADRHFMGMWGMVNTPVLKDPGDHPVPVLDDSMLAKQVQWYTDLALQYAVMPREEMSALTSAAMWPEVVPFLDAAPRPTRFGLVPFPNALEQGTLFSSLGYVMSAGTAHPDEAWQWLAFLSRQRVVTSLGGQRAIPARRSVAESTGYWETLPPEVTTICQQVLDRLCYPPPWDVAEPVEQAVAAVLAGEAEVDEALRAAQSQAWAQLAMGSIRPTPTPLSVVEPISTHRAGDASIIQFFDFASPDRYKKVIELFESAHPDIRIRLVKSYEIGQETEPGVKIIRFTDLASDSDCFKALPADGDEFALTLDLEPLLDTDAGFPLDDFYPGFLNQYP